jgi:SAM-dependent methyltransferase
MLCAVEPSDRRNGPSATGFDYDWVSVEDYERYRPGYAPEAVGWMVRRTGLLKASEVADLAAGTGKLTRLLVEAGLKVTAVEPSARMRGVLAQVVDEAQVVDGTAESIPLPDASLDCVVVGQAFHHFRGEEALAEIGRVLRPEGHLALFWNTYVKDDPVKLALDEILDRYADPSSAVCAAFGSWPQAFQATRGFAKREVREFAHVHGLPSAGLAPLFATSSDVASLPKDRLDSFLADVEAFALTVPDQVTIPAVTRVDLFSKV